MAGNGYKKSRRKSQINDNCPFLPFSADDCQTIAPAAGYRNGTSVNNQGSNGNYWSGTLNEGNSNNAYYLNFNNGNVNWNNNNRNNGHSVRPVSELMQPSASLSPEQLLLDLFRAYKDARRGKRKKTYQLRFEMNLEQELVSLRDELISKKYQPRPSACLIVSELKKVIGSLHNLFEFGRYGRYFQKFLPYRSFIIGNSCIFHPSVIFQ